jgi:hypothetical protein
MISSSLLSAARLFGLDCGIERQIRGSAPPVKFSIVSEASDVSLEIVVSKIPLRACLTQSVVLGASREIALQAAVTTECQTKRDIRVTPAPPARYPQ